MKRSGKESKPELIRQQDWVKFLFWDNKRSNESERSDMFDLYGEPMKGSKGDPRDASSIRRGDARRKIDLTMAHFSYDWATGQ